MGEGSKSATIASARLHGITADSSFTARNLHGTILRLLGCAALDLCPLGNSV